MRTDAIAERSVRKTQEREGTSHEVVGIEAVIPGGDYSASTSSLSVASSSSRGGYRVAIEASEK